MKVECHEYDGCFSIELTAEHMQEAAFLTRFGMNRTEEVRSANTYVNADGQFEASVVFGKSKRSNNDVPRRK